MAFTKHDVEQLSSDHSEPAWLREARLAAWQPEATEEVAHRRAAIGLGDQRIELSRQHTFRIRPWGRIAAARLRVAMLRRS